MRTSSKFGKVIFKEKRDKGIEWGRNTAATLLHNFEGFLFIRWRLFYDFFCKLFPVDLITREDVKFFNFKSSGLTVGRFFYLSNPSAKLKQLDGRKETVYWNFEGEKWQIILWMCVDKRRDTEWKRFQLFRNLLIFVTIFHNFFLEFYRLKIPSLRWPWVTIKKV